MSEQQQDELTPKQMILKHLEGIDKRIEHLQNGIEAALTFPPHGVVVHREHTLEILIDITISTWACRDLLLEHPEDGEKHKWATAETAKAFLQASLDELEIAVRSTELPEVLDTALVNVGLATMRFLAIKQELEAGKEKITCDCCSYETLATNQFCPRCSYRLYELAEEKGVSREDVRSETTHPEI